jgi:lactate dehydrogenase-like 2-hydroxyacid dehydrogenase
MRAVSDTPAAVSLLAKGQVGQMVLDVFARIRVATSHIRSITFYY